MAVTDSRVRYGSLRIKDCADAWKTYSCQPTSVKITPGSEEGTEEKVEVLCGDELTDSESGSKSATLEITAISDFLDCDGFVANSWKCPGTREFEWIPNADKDPTHVWRGTVAVKEIEVGGDVNTRLTPGISWDVKSLFLPTCYGGKQWMGPKATGFKAPVGPALEWVLEPAGAIPPETLAALKSDGLLGDSGRGRPSRSFTSGEFFSLSSSPVEKVHYNTTGGWATGVAP